MSSVATATGALLANGLIRIGLPVRRRSAWAPFIYLAVIAMAEWTTVAANAAGGLTLHAAILLALLFHGARCRAYRERALLWALALAPLIRVLSLSLPLASFPVVYWYAIISVPAFIAIGVTGRVLGYSRQDLGLSMRVALVPLTLVMAGLGFGLAVVEYFILLQPLPLVPNPTPSNTWQPALILIVTTGFGEELLFRGLLQHAASEMLGAGSLLYVTVLFTSLHVGYGSLLNLAFVFAVGLLFAAIRWWTRSIVASAMAHSTLNITLYLVAPIIFAPVLAG